MHVLLIVILEVLGYQAASLAGYAKDHAFGKPNGRCSAGERVRALTLEHNLREPSG